MWQEASRPPSPLAPRPDSRATNAPYWGTPRSLVKFGKNSQFGTTGKLGEGQTTFGLRGRCPKPPLNMEGNAEIHPFRRSKGSEPRIGDDINSKGVETHLLVYVPRLEPISLIEASLEFLDARKAQLGRPDFEPGVHVHVDHI